MSFSHCLIIMNLGDSYEHIWKYILDSNEWFLWDESFNPILQTYGYRNMGGYICA